MKKLTHAIQAQAAIKKALNAGLVRGWKSTFKGILPFADFKIEEGRKSVNGKTAWSESKRVEIRFEKNSRHESYSKSEVRAMAFEYAKALKSLGYDVKVEMVKSWHYDKEVKVVSTWHTTRTGQF